MTKIVERYLPSAVALGLGLFCLTIITPLTLIILGGTYVYDKIYKTDYYTRLKNSILNPYRNNNKKKILVFK